MIIMDTFYTDERNTQMLIGLLKAHNVKKVVASPGNTNVCLVASIQHDDYFEIYSAIDERSAAYMACGLAAESGEPVALSCTGATASRNYVPGLTEAYYRKLPILAITSTQYIGRIGHHFPQVIDRTNLMNDIANKSVQIPIIHDKEEEWACEVLLNSALLELRHRGGGPVHINLTTSFSTNYDVRTLPPVRVINRIRYCDSVPSIKAEKVAIFVGVHNKWSDELTRIVDKFCAMYNAVVVCDHTSNYVGKYRAFMNLLSHQAFYKSECLNMDLMIHIGEVSGAYINVNPQDVWRVNPDGEIRDTFKKLSHLYEMEEFDFFKKYVDLNQGNNKHTYIDEYRQDCLQLEQNVPDLPFSNIWIAKNTVSKLPEGCALYLGILNTLRSWNLFECSVEITGYSNTGGFGIEGGISAQIGASLNDSTKLYFCITGDLSFFYDMNSIGNRHVGNNFRLMVINNGAGTEFKLYGSASAQFGNETDEFIAAAGHYGNKSEKLVKDYATNLGFKYISASDKEEFLNQIDIFTDNILDQPIVFEVFTNCEDESDALKAMSMLVLDSKNKAKSVIKNVLGESGVRTVKKILKRN